MKRIAATAVVSALAAAWATEESMNQALQAWEQQVAQYEAAVKNAADDTARAAIEIPTGRDIAPQLWQSICARTGTRNATKGSGRVPVYEFEQAWALPAIVWILEHPQAFTAAFTDEEQAQLTYFGNALVQSLNQVHYANPGIAAACPSLAATSSVREYDLLQKIYQRNQNKETRACAALGMSLMLNNPMVSSVEGSEAMARAKRLYYLKQSLLLSGKETRFGKRPITEVAMEQAYYLRHLAIGSIAPQLKVKDMQGTTHTFPELQKLNLFIFWSPADATGTSMVRDVEKLKAEYPGIVICPVIPHAAPEDVQQALDAAGINFTYVDDAKGTAGSTYRVTELPTTVLISKKSTILYSGDPDIKLKAALDNAVAAENAAAKANRPRVMVKESPAPQIQPGSTPKPEDSVPGLREMPEF